MSNENQSTLQNYNQKEIPPFPFLQDQEQPTLENLYSKANELYKETRDEDVKKAMQQVDNQDGTMTDKYMRANLNRIADEFDKEQIVTTNMSDGAKHTEEEIIRQIKLNNKDIESLKDPNILEKLLILIKKFLFDFDPEKEIQKKEIENKILIKEGQNAVKDGKITIYDNCKLQIGSILKDKHFTAFIIDRDEKAIILIGPNGHILDENENYKNVQSKKEMLTTLFGPDKATELMSEGWKLCDANCYKENSNEYKQKSKKIFDIITYTDEQKNLKDIQSKNGACGFICCMFIERYRDGKFQVCQQRGKIGNMMQNFLNKLNKVCKSTEQTIAKYQLSNAIKVAENKKMRG